MECPFCGVVVAKWRPKPETHAPPVRPTRRKRRAFTTFVALAIPVLLLAIAASLLLRNPPGDVLQRIRERGDRALKQSADPLPEFDVRIDLPGSPAGVASNGREIVVANRKDPWGLIRLRGSGERFVAEKIPLLEPRYSQKIQVHTLAWNGENYVGLASGAWFGVDARDVFTIHDPATLQVVRHVPAPPLLGCLAWDGTSYWASTRKNTMDANEEAFLYRLDRAFNVVATHKPPAVGCQGLMWDGTRLWFADVFNDSIYLLDVTAGEPRLLHKAMLGLNYLSGIGLHDGAIWIAEYDNDDLHRLNAATRLAWSGDRQQTTAIASMVPARTDAPDEAALRQQLRSEHWAERMRADMELERRGAPIDYARDQNNFADRAPENTEDLDWAVEMRDGAIWLVSSRVWFGPELFVKREQKSTMVTVPEFARYTFTVKHPDGSQTEKVFDAVAGENVRTNERLADAIASGTYSVSLFIHVQYTDATGTGRILNNSAGFLELRR